MNFPGSSPFNGEQHLDKTWKPLNQMTSNLAQSSLKPPATHEPSLKNEHALISVIMNYMFRLEDHQTYIWTKCEGLGQAPSAAAGDHVRWSKATGHRLKWTWWWDQLFLRSGVHWMYFMMSWESLQAENGESEHIWRHNDWVQMTLWGDKQCSP